MKVRLIEFPFTLITFITLLPGVQNKVHLDTETLKKSSLCDNSNKTQIMCITFWTSFLVFLYDGMQVNALCMAAWPFKKF